MLRQLSRAVVMAAAVGLFLGGAGTEARGQYSRRTPIVEAVQKTRAGIVSIKVERRGSWGRKEVGGTGVIVDERGYVVTNRHVVASGSQILVRLAEGGEVAAEVVVDDSRHDLAVLRLSTTRRLSALRFGPSSDLLVGETVIAIGHPYGYTNTVSTGIISALGREVAMPSGEMLRDLIQVTASINPGNSGGPLLNINGELIGINVALREGAQGIAFALNADSVQQVLAGHLSAAKISGVHHGLSCTETTVAEDGPNRQRVVVEEATHAAAAAGVQRGDEVVRIGDRAVCNRLDVERAVWDRKAGEKVAVTVRRDGKEIALAIPLERSGEDRPTVARVSNSPAASPLPVSPIRVEGLRTRKP